MPLVNVTLFLFLFLSFLLLLLLLESRLESHAAFTAMPTNSYLRMN